MSNNEPGAAAKDAANVTLAETDQSPWYAGIGRYPWLVLIIASAGWVFDVYEGQIFNITGNDMLGELLGGVESAVKEWKDRFLAIFLFGGTDPAASPRPYWRDPCPLRKSRRNQD